MTCKVNGKVVSHGNMKEMDWTIAELIERISYGVDILPGDVIGSGTVGTGCFLELNGTGLLNNPDFQAAMAQGRRCGRNGNYRPWKIGKYDQESEKQIFQSWPLKKISRENLTR